MSELKYFLAIDLGASSGRHIIGYKDNNGKFITDEIHRFRDYLIDSKDGLVWKTDFILDEIKIGIKKALVKYPEIESMAIDTWGVDYVLMDGEKEILPVYAYRNPRTKEVVDEVHSKICFEDIYKNTGSQFQEFNTLYQLSHDKKNNRLDNATDFLMIPEYLNFKLTGIKKKEYTNATTTGFYNLHNNCFCNEILKKVGLNEKICLDIEKPGSIVGNFTNEVAAEVGGNIKVVLCASHDTASAIESLDIDNEVLYLSSGTWSLLGMKIKEPITSEESKNSNFSNEGGVGYIRYQKNIMGLWIIQSVSKELGISIEDLKVAARKTKEFHLFDVNNNDFLSPKSMVKTIQNHIGKIVNVNVLSNSIHHSLAKSYEQAVNDIERLTNKRSENLYIIGGGANNIYLNELTEKYTKKKVIVLPIEATAIGNLKVQMEAYK